MLRDYAAKESGLTNGNGLDALGQAANEIAASEVFTDYRERRAANTIRRHDADLAKFAEYLRSKGVQVGDLAHDAQAWTGVTWGLAAGFMRWQLNQGYAVNTVNARLSAVKTYSQLAMKAGAIDVEAYALIKAVEGYSRKEVKRINEHRSAAGIETRRGLKKAEAVSLANGSADALKAQPDTPQGRRDALVMSLLLDHGLRVSEVEGLRVDDFDLEAGTVTFYRPKVDNTGTHRLSADTWQAAREYLTQSMNGFAGPLLMGSHKGGKLSGTMSSRAIAKRVRALGEQVGKHGLSPHDCRHYAATKLAKEKSIPELMDIFGWTSSATAVRYIEAAKIVEVE